MLGAGDPAQALRRDRHAVGDAGRKTGARRASGPGDPQRRRERPDVGLAEPGRRQRAHHAEFAQGAHAGSALEPVIGVGGVEQHGQSQFVGAPAQRREDEPLAVVTAVRRVREDLGSRGEVEVDDLVPHADLDGAPLGVGDFPPIQKEGSNRGGGDAIPSTRRATASRKVLSTPPE